MNIIIIVIAVAVVAVFVIITIIQLALKANRQIIKVVHIQADVSPYSKKYFTVQLYQRSPYSSLIF